MRPEMFEDPGSCCFAMRGLLSRRRFWCRGWVWRCWGEGVGEEGGGVGGRSAERGAGCGRMKGGGLGGWLIGWEAGWGGGGGGMGGGGGRVGEWRDGCALEVGVVAVTWVGVGLSRGATVGGERACGWWEAAGAGVVEVVRQRRGRLEWGVGWGLAEWTGWGRRGAAGERGDGGGGKGGDSLVVVGRGEWGRCWGDLGSVGWVGAGGGGGVGVGWEGGPAVVELVARGRAGVGVVLGGGTGSGWAGRGGGQWEGEEKGDGGDGKG
ncbi:hypothetical protein Tco_1407108 [Tanacetum coccineum]